MIFLVDDSNTIRMSMSEILTKSGYVVETACDGLAALEKLKTFKPTLMITDLNMPKMNGLDLIREVRKIAPLRFMPILILTTESQQQKKEEAKTIGATGWLVKPVPATDLINVIRQVAPSA